MRRRTFLRAGSLAGAAVMFRGVGAPVRARAATTLPSVDDPRYLEPVARADAIPQFVNPLTRPARLDLTCGGARTLVMRQTWQDLLGADLGLTTPVWGFGEDRRGWWDDSIRVSYPGPTIVARSEQPVRIHWRNELPSTHLLPVDTSLHWAFSHNDQTIDDAGMPAVVHLHGGHNAPESDGHPEAWYTPRGVVGPRFDGTAFDYDNSQEAATLWYHDHTLGITRLNVYAGLSGFYLLRDDHELDLIERNELPADPYELELVIQDRMFTPDGRLAYPDLPATAADWPGGPSTPPEFFGPVILVNGRAWPYLAVEPRQYRLRLLNGSNSRIYRLSVQGDWPFPITQIGTDGGFLYEPTPLDQPLLICPGERVDVVVDFRDLGGATFELTNDAPTPFPGGAPVAPPADMVLQFRVDQRYDSTRPEPTLPSTLRDAPFAVSPPPERTRRLLLFEGEDMFGRLRTLLGTVELGARAWSDPVTEDPDHDTAEIWEVYNTTADSHPMHVHLVQFEVLDRAPFTADQDPQTAALSNIQIGTREPPDATERGPKDTVHMDPGQVTRIKAHFDRRGTYIWHCHMLEHEDHEMMREYEVV